MKALSIIATCSKTLASSATTAPEARKCESSFMGPLALELTGRQPGERPAQFRCRLWLLWLRAANRRAVSGSAPAQHQPVAGSVHRGKQQAGQEGEMIDEEAELRLVARPMRWTVEGEGQEDHIDSGQNGRLLEEDSGEKGE